jgi:hypothetical protein
MKVSELAAAVSERLLGELGAEIADAKGYVERGN